MALELGFFTGIDRLESQNVMASERNALGQRAVKTAVPDVIIAWLTRL
jgi:hypothetical protein